MTGNRSSAVGRNRTGRRASSRSWCWRTRNSMAFTWWWKTRPASAPSAWSLDAQPADACLSAAGPLQLPGGCPPAHEERRTVLDLDRLQRSLDLGHSAQQGGAGLEIKPAIGLTPSPTIPMLDGEVSGFFTKTLYFNAEVPGELRDIFSLPTLPLVSREISVGQGNYQLGYDPAEEGANSPGFRTCLSGAAASGQRQCVGSWYRLFHPQSDRLGAHLYLQLPPRPMPFASAGWRRA